MRDTFLARLSFAARSAWAFLDTVQLPRCPTICTKPVLTIIVSAQITVFAAQLFSQRVKNAEHDLIIVAARPIPALPVENECTANVCIVSRTPVVGLQAETPPSE